MANVTARTRGDHDLRLLRDRLLPKTITTSQRTAWLLRVNRLFGSDERWIRANQFSLAFRGGSWVDGVNESKVSRWETGFIRVPYLAIRRYEELLELPTQSLVSTVDTINRYAAPAVGGPSLLDRGFGRDRDGAVRRLEQLLDKIVCGEAATGMDWDELTSILSATPDIVLVPTSTWGEITGRLMSEMVIADGLPWMRRFEALNRLLGHPAGQEATVATCATFAADRANQVVVEAISALDGTNHPDASSHVLAQLHDPTSELAFYGALLACVRKTRYGHFTSSQNRRLLAVVDQLLTDSMRHDDARPLAAQVLRQLPRELRDKVPSLARKGLSSDQVVDRVLATGRLAIDTAPVVIGRILNRVTSMMPREIPGFTDHVLPTLIDEILFSPVLDVRLYASVLIEASPYREPLARVLAMELADPDVTKNENFAGALLGALRILGGPAERPIVERIIVAAGLPNQVVATAAHAIGHIHGRSGDSYWKRAISHYGRLWQRHGDSASAAVLHDLVYALGMAGNDALLTSIRNDHSAPGPVRAAAAWWLGIPRLIRDSAGQ